MAALFDPHGPPTFWERVSRKAPQGSFARGVLWLLLLGPFFFLSYGWANHWALSVDSRAPVPSVLFTWEALIPFVPWTIVPYWSIDALYGLSFLMCRNPRETDRHALRLLSAQVAAVACFVLLPLRFAFPKPEASGFFGSMFQALAQFDLPYNQAPSLHVALAIILGWRFAKGRSPAWTWAAIAWGGLIVVSVLTTYQHHFFDIPTGAALGLLCLWAFPDQGASPLRPRGLKREGSARLASIYLALALALLAAGIFLGSWALWLAWPALSCALVAWIYAACGPEGFQKGRSDNAERSMAAFWLLAPALAGAWLNSRLWTRNDPAPRECAPGVWIGRWPGRSGRAGFERFVDLAAEMGRVAPDRGRVVASLPWLDLVAPTPDQLSEAALAIEESRLAGKTLVSCALGYSRSAAALCAWLLSSGRAGSVEEAEAMVRLARPRVVLGPAHRAALAEILARSRHGATS
jgi:membrane-associated phospholipid phosphatase